MKKATMVLMAVMAVLATESYAQAGNFSAGLLMSRFTNQSGEHRLSEVQHPVGTGIVAGYMLRDNIGIAVTGEFYNNNLESSAGTEKASRVHATLVGMPYQHGRFSMYVSGGIVYSYRTQDRNGISSSSDDVQARFGLGADYRVYQNISVTADAGFYHDGWNLTGWGSSLAFRYAFRMF